MIKKTLTEVENRAISKIVDKYRNLEVDLVSIQDQLEKLDKEKAIMLKTLDSIRNEELTFFRKLKKTYGEGKLDILTMEYIVTKLE